MLIHEIKKNVGNCHETEYKKRWSHTISEKQIWRINTKECHLASFSYAVIQRLSDGDGKVSSNIKR